MYVLVLFCAVLRMLAVAQAEAQYFIIAPNVIRVDVDETILVNVLGMPDDVRVPVTLYFQLTGSNRRISETTVSITNDAPQEAILRISRDQLIQPESRGQQFITLVASASTAHLQIQDRRTILLSYQAGFVFIQTDKPLYTPTQRVDIRVVALDQDMVPASHELQLDIVNPDQIIVHRYNRAPQKGFLTLQFDFPPNPVFGNWTVVANYGHQLKVNTSVQFEVKEYVLPKFYVEVSTQEKYIVPETKNLFAHVTARYVFGEPVVGSFLVMFGVFTDDGNLTILQRKQGTLNDQGRASKDLVMADVDVIDWTETLMGKPLLIQAFVTDTSSGETISVNNTMVTFSRTPYKFSWDLTQRYFKRGLPFAVKANLQFMSGLPAASIDVSVSATAQLDNGDQVSLGGTLVKGIAEPVKKQSGPQGELDFRLDVPASTDLITIHLKTEDPALSESSQSSSTFTVQRQQSTSGEYLLVRLPSSGNSRQTQVIGRRSSIEVQLTHPENVNTLHYFVIAGGRVVHKGAKHLINPSTALGFQITHEMAPSSRVVAYYASATGHIIADALFMDVEERCENPIHLRFENIEKDLGIFKTNGSNKNIDLRISANEYTTIGLLAVDEAVFTLRNYHRLTQKKVFKRMAGYDLGCGPGGGQTSATIFKDAGVTVMTNAEFNVAQREALGCPGDVRRSRRSVSQLDHDKIVNGYNGILRVYCAKGLRQVKDQASLSCADRARRLAKRKRVAQDAPEIVAFVECCEELEKISRGRVDGGNNDVGGGNNDMGSSVNPESALVRSNFPESWMFTEVETGDNDFVRHQATLPDTVTTWVIEAVGVSEDYDMCVADPVKLQVRPPFFLDIGMPYSVQRYEQIEIIVSVFNYADTVLQVSVYLKGVEGVCSEAQPGSYSKEIAIEVLPKKPASVKFVIVPLEAKKLPIEVVAVTNSSGHYKDAVRKLLTVRPEGYRQRDTVTVTVDPGNVRDSPKSTQAGGKNQSYQHTQFWGDEGEHKQVDIIRYALSSEAIPGTHQVHVSLMGNMMGNVIETVIGGLDDLLKIPTGCGEQTMLHLAPNVYVYQYLKHSDQFTAALETSANRFIGDGIANELSHRRPDGSFSVWGANPSYPSSTWLTAFVSKVMCQAKEFAFIDDTITCQAMDWLIAETQQEDGSFIELYRVHHQEMTGGVQGQASLTAYVLISLLECDCKTIDKRESVADAVAFLQLQLPALTRPYAIAITVYALALANSINAADDAIGQLKDIAVYDKGSNFRHWGYDDSSFGAGPKPYWYSNKPKAIEVETTSYALLALLQVDEIQYAHAIVNWLTDQENYEGGFVSTQDTVIALQALSEYAIQSQQNDVDIDCHVTCEESDFEDTFLLKPHNAIVRQHANIDVPESSSQIHVFFDSQGQGMGQIKLESSFYIPEPDTDKCDFDLVVNGVEGKSGDGVQQGGDVNTPADGDSRSRVGRVERDAFSRDRSSGNGQESVGATIEAPRKGRAGGTGTEHVFEYNIKVRYLRGEATGMAILDVGLYTGYQPTEGELDYVKSQSHGLIQRYELTERSVIFYLTRITRSETVQIKFGARRVFLVGRAQPVAVRVYDYYNPTMSCVKFVHPQLGSSLLSTLCEGDTCICAAGNCADNPFARLPDFDVSKLKEKACASSSHFAYEVEVVGKQQKGSFQYFTVTIIAKLKDGLDEVRKGENRTFWKSKTSCGTPDLKKRKYLVIGSGGLATTNSMGLPSYKYVIDEKMSFYEWPTATKVASTKKWRKINENLNALKQDLVVGNGCTT